MKIMLHMNFNGTSLNDRNINVDIVVAAAAVMRVSIRFASVSVIARSKQNGNCS